MITPAWVSSSQASQGTERRRNALPGAALSLTIPLSWSYIASRASGPLRPPAISSSDNPLTAPSEDHLAVPAWQVANRDTFLTQTGQLLTISIALPMGAQGGEGEMLGHRSRLRDAFSAADLLPARQVRERTGDSQRLGAFIVIVTSSLGLWAAIWVAVKALASVVLR